MISADHNQEDPAAVGLTESERDEASDRTAVRAAVVHEAIRTEGEGELQRSFQALVWSGLAAGLSMGFSLVATGLLESHLDGAARSLVGHLGYCVGFLAVILGRQQLFTENTLTVMLPLMTRRDFATALNVLRVWSVVLVANLVGTYVFAYALAKGSIVSPEVSAAFTKLAFTSLAPSWGTLLLRGIFAGWLVALLVWMMPAADNSKPLIIIIITYLIALGHFPHVIAGAVESCFLVSTGATPWSGLAHFVLTLTRLRPIALLEFIANQFY
jgi:formate/nitrite transporter FocA (FNT family)